MKPKAYTLAWSFLRVIFQAAIGGSTLAEPGRVANRIDSNAEGEDWWVKGAFAPSQGAM